MKQIENLLATKPMLPAVAQRGGCLNHGSLFSGIGGFDLAAQWMGWNNIFHCEWNPFGQQILKQHFPNSITYEDITKTDFKKHKGEIDIISGGFPCQPFSSTGKRKGTDDDRYLWDEMLRAIREVQPSYIVAENVRGLTNWNKGLVFDKVQADLEAEGFEVLPFLLPACAVNAPHRRDRIWFVAYSSGSRWTFRQPIGEEKRNASHGIAFENDVQNSIEYKSELESMFNGDYNGVSERMDRIKALGNAIVPQVAYEIFKCIGLLAAAPLSNCR